MISQEGVQKESKRSISLFIKDVDCQNNAELAAALTALINRAVLMLEHRAGGALASQALYEPFSLLSKQYNEKAVDDIKRQLPKDKK
jgi:hypothetical protein